MAFGLLAPPCPKAKEKIPELSLYGDAGAAKVPVAIMRPEPMDWIPTEYDKGALPQTDDVFFAMPGGKAHGSVEGSNAWNQFAWQVY